MNNTTILDPHLFIEPACDEKVVQELMEQFNNFFTYDQVKQTLIANQNDKLKTNADLKYKESKVLQRDSLYSLIWLQPH